MIIKNRSNTVFTRLAKQKMLARMGPDGWHAEPNLITLPKKILA